MKLNYELPQIFELELRGKLMEKKISYSIPFDLTRNLEFTTGYVVATDDEIFILTQNPSSQKIELEQIKLEENMEFEMKEYNSSGGLEMLHNSEQRSLVYFTLSNISVFASLAQALTNICKSEQTYFSEEDFDETKCPKCGRPYLKRTKFCMKCGNRMGSMKRLIIMAKPIWPYYAAIISFFWVNAAILLYQPMVVKDYVINVLDPATRKGADINVILKYTVILAVLGIIQVIFRVISSMTTTVASSKFTTGLRAVVHNKIQSLSVNYIEAKKTGELMHRVTKDTERLQNFVDNILLTGVNELFMLFAVAVMLFLYNWKMALVVLLPTPILFLVFKIWHHVWKYYHMQWQKFDKLNSFLNDILRGIRVVKAFGQEEQAVKQFKNDAAMLRDITIANEKRFFTIWPLTNFVFGIGGQFLVLYCGNLVLNGGMNIGEIVQLSTYASYFYQRIEYVVSLPRWINEAVVNAQRIFEILDAKPAITPREKTVAEVFGNVKFDEVTFGYLTYKNVLKNISIDVKQGEMIGLVGHSGAGKSTMINLIMRMFEPQSGKILIDEKNINNLARESYQHQLGVVLQETFLFSGSVLDNIRYAKPDATIDEVINAAKIANAHEFIINFPMGYDSRVGENGQKLSGGERQRIAIARAILVNPKILILDEATASVDTETEKQIQDAFRKVTKNRTTFAIAHRLSTLKNADRIVVLDNGKIIEMGGHRELIEKQGKYYQLVMAQKTMSAIKGIE